MNREEAIKICKELWTYLAETGKKKLGWEGWVKYGEMLSDCPFCEYTDTVSDPDADDWCKPCPYYAKFGDCIGDYGDTPFDEWCSAGSPKTRKKYAKEFLAQLEQL